MLTPSLPAQTVQPFSHDAAGNLTAVGTAASATAPAIVSLSPSVTLRPGEAHALVVVASGSGPFVYQWFKGDDPIPGGSRASLLIASASAADAGTYSVRVGNGAGVTPSDPVQVTVAAPVDPLAVAVGQPDLVWRQGGTSFWRVFETSDRTHDGVSAIGTGVAQADDSYVETDIVGPKTLSFWVKLPDRGSYWGSRLELFANGVLVRQFSNWGEAQTRDLSPAEWHQVTLDVPPGSWALRWRHVTPANGSMFLDDVTLTTPPDTDADGLSDDWESRHFGPGNLAQSATDNTDGDEAHQGREYQDFSDPNAGDPSAFGSFNFHVWTATQGAGSVVLSPAQASPGYGTTPESQLADTRIRLEAVPEAGHLFSGWIDAAHGVTYLANPLVDVQFDGMPLPEGRNRFDFGAWRSRSFTALFEPEIPLAEAADTPGRTWTTGGHAPWVGQSRWTSDATDALRSGALPNEAAGQQSWIQTTVTGPVKLTWQQLREGGSAGQLFLSVNGWAPESLQLLENGTWVEHSVLLPPGSHDVRWLALQHTDGIPSTFALDQLSFTATTDSDVDGLADEWEQLYFGNLDRDGEDDTDFDGSPALAEYQNFSSPTNGRHRAALVVEAVGGGTATVTPQRSLYLMGWAGVSQPAETVTVNTVPDADRRFENWENGLGTILKGGNESLLPASHTVDLTHPPAGYRLTARHGPLLGVGMDQPNRTFDNADRYWRTRSTTTMDGIDSVETLPLMANGQSTLATEVAGPAVVSFWWKSSGETDRLGAFCSVLTLGGGGGTVAEIGGEMPWRREFIVLPPGQHQVSWTAWNQGSQLGSNQVWIDQLQVATDTDQDGLGDAWEMAHFDNLDATAGSDGDADGNTNQVEFGDNTDPTEASSAAYRLTLLPEERNSVALEPAHGPYAPGSTVAVTAAPAFLAWGGDATGSVNPLTLTMNGNKSLTVSFHPFARAVDNTQLVWQRGDPHPWQAYFPEAPAGYAHEDWIHTPAGLADGEESWVQTTVEGPCSLRFHATLNSDWNQATGYYSHLRWTVDGVEVGRWDPNGAPDRSLFVPAGSHTVRWIYQRGIGETSETAGGRLDRLAILPQPVAAVAVAEAVDADTLTWTVAGDSPWLGGVEDSHDGQDAAFSWGTPAGGESVLEATVNGPGTLSFWWKTSNNGSNHALRFEVDGQPAVPAITGGASWKKVRLEIRGAGSHSLRWVHRHYLDYWGQSYSDTSWVDEVVFTPATTVALPVALDQTELPWTTSSSAWYGVTSPSHDGVDAAVSGPVADGETSWVQTEVTGPGTLSFWWKASTKSTDYGFILMDGYRPFDDDSIQGETAWLQKTLEIPAGHHTLQWRYSKGSDSSSLNDPGHQDRIWLDEVTWEAGPQPPVLVVEQPVGVNLPQDGTLALGDVAIGATGTRTVTLKNTGTAALELQGLELFPSPSNGFAVSAPGTSTVAGGGSTTFTVTLSPTSTGTRSAWLSISSNASNAATYWILLTGNGTGGTVAEGPEISVEEPQFTPLVDGATEPVDYGLATVGQQPFKSFWIRNLGNAPLTGIGASLTGAQASSFPILHRAATSLAPGASTYVVVSFKPAAAGVHNAQLKITSNDADEKPFDILLTGEGVDPTPPQFTESPASLMLAVGTPATFSAAATGDPEPSFQWRKGSAAIAGANASVYTLAAVTLAHAGAYRVQASNAASTVTSEKAELGVVDVSDKTYLVAEGGSVSLTCLAAGTDITYLWRRKDGTPLTGSARHAGVTQKTLKIKGLQTSDTDVYVCDVSGAAGELTSGDHSVTVFNAPPDITPLADGDALPVGIVGRPYSYQVPFDPAPERIPTKFTATNLPKGLTLDNAGLIHGTPTAAKMSRDGEALAHTVKITAANKLKDEVTVSLLITPLPAGAIGVFEGPVAGDAALNDHLGGRFDLKTEPSGSFSGKVSLGANVHSFTGVLAADAAGLAPEGTAEILRKGLAPLTLTFTIDSANQRIDVAEITDGTDSAAILAWRNPWSASNPATAWAGYYTFRLTANPPSAAAPMGHGFGSFTVSASNGTLSLKGMTADGESLTGKAFVGPQGQLLFHRVLYGPTVGTVTGGLTLDPGASAADADNTLGGQVTWSRPENTPANTRLYPAGFGPLSLTVAGGRYLPTPLILGLSAGTNNARLVFRDAGIGDPAPGPDITVGIGLRNKVTYPELNPRKTSLTFNAKTGHFSGKFTLEDANPLPPPAKPAVIKRAVTYQGIIVPEGNALRGQGYFLLPGLPDPESPTPLLQSGQVLFEQP